MVDSRASRATEWGLIEGLNSQGGFCSLESAHECRITVMPLDVSFMSITISGDCAALKTAAMEKCLDLAYRRGYQTAQRDIRSAMGVQEPSR